MPPLSASLCQGWTGDLLRQLAVVVSPRQPVAANLAADEAQMRSAAADRRVVLRLWWGDAPTVVLGNSEEAAQVADLAACQRLGVSVLRRTTGGGAILQGPGVLNYALTAPAPRLFDLRRLFTLGSTLLIGALARLGVAAEARGTSDIVVDERKISGNSQAWRGGGLLLHGTLLLELDLDLVAACLRHPPREPAYRRGRSHRDFLTTLHLLGVPATPVDVEAAVSATAREMAACDTTLEAR